MSEIIKSNNIEWLEISQKIYTGNYPIVITKLEEALEACAAASFLVILDKTVSNLTLPVTADDIEELNEKRRKLVSFVNGIHYEISQLVDNPFALMMGNVAEVSYDLDPSDIEVKVGDFGPFDIKASLTGLVYSSIEDEKLKTDFKAKADALDDDVVPYKLDQAILEAEYWKNEYEKSIECGEIANAIFTPEVREQWADITPEERLAYITQYKDEISVVLGEGTHITPDDIGFCNGFGVSYNVSGIGINEAFIYEPTGNYSLDKLIDTTTHEMRHQYQDAAVENPDKYGVPDGVYEEWTQKYIDSGKYTKYYQQPIEADAKAYAALSRLNY